MTIGDRVRLHLNPGWRDVLGVPETVGTIRAIEATSDRWSVLIHFDDVSVYLSPIAGREIEVVRGP